MEAGGGGELARGGGGQVDAAAAVEVGLDGGLGVRGVRVELHGVRFDAGDGADVGGLLSHLRMEPNV